jgi:hypothetical protein
LDRSHTSSVKNVDVKTEDKKVTFILSGDEMNRELEVWGAESKKALFEEVFGVKVEFEAPK